MDLPLHADLGQLAQRRRGLLRQVDQAAAQARRLPIDRRPPSRHQPLPRRDQQRTQALHLDSRSRRNHRRRQAWAPSVRFDPLGWQAIRHAAEPLPPALAEHGPAGNLAAFRRGFLTNMTNPKVAVFFASVFASVYGAGMPEWINLAVLGGIAIDEVVWYSLVALAFSSRPAQTAYGRAKRWIDRAFGAFLALFGIRLLWNLRLLAG